MTGANSEKKPEPEPGESEEARPVAEEAETAKPDGLEEAEEEQEKEHDEEVVDEPATMMVENVDWPFELDQLRGWKKHDERQF